MLKEIAESITIPTIMAEAETATETVVAETAPSLSEAYTAGENKGLEEKTRRKEEHGRNTRLSEEEDSARSLTSSLETARAPKKDQTLSQAYAGEAVEDADVLIEQDGLPESLQQFGLDDVAAVMARFGLTNEDLADPRWQSAIADVLQSQSNTEEAEEAGEEDDPEKAKTEEEKKDEQKPEEKKPEPRPSKLADLTPEQRVEMGKHIEQVWSRAQQVNAPIYTEKFVSSLASALQTPPEQMEALNNTVEVLQWGAQNLIESALPALVHGYLRQNFAGVMEAYAPGFANNYTSDVLNRTWEEVRGNDLPKFGTAEFKELAKEIHLKHPFLNDIDFKDSKGKPLPTMDALRAKAELTARLCRGERITPQTIQDAVARGREDATKNNRRVSASRALGTGRTTGAIGQKKETATSLRDAYTAQHDGVV
jgi:hypothetical protein